MLHPHIRVRKASSSLGFETAASCAIPKGTIVWVETEEDQTIDADDLRAMDFAARMVLERYAYVRSDDGRLVLCSEPARYTNHACDANILAVTDDVTVAIRDIEADEPITEDYATFNRTYAFACGCGATECRGRVSVEGDERRHLERSLTARLRSVLPCILRAPQPLWPHVPAETQATLRTWATGSVDQHDYRLQDPVDFVALLFGPRLRCPRNLDSSGEQL